MSIDTSRNGATEGDWNCVADESSECLETYLTIFRHKSVIARETLENGGFSQRDGPILLRMAESTIPETVALGSHGGRRFIPFHSPVDTRIGFSAVRAVAVRNQVLGPITPG